MKKPRLQANNFSLCLEFERFFTLFHFCCIFRKTMMFSANIRQPECFAAKARAGLWCVEGITSSLTQDPKTLA
jgi:hypothetical protein